MIRIKYIFLILSLFFFSCDETGNGPSNDSTNCPTFSVTTVSGGDASTNNFTVSFSSETNIVLGFNLSGNTLAIGCGDLVEFTNNNGEAENLDGIVFSGSNSTSLDISFLSGNYTDGCSLPINSISIYDNKIIYNSNSLISGFQFQIQGSNVVICPDNSTACTYEECPITNYFNSTIDETGESTLFIFSSSINNLTSGDEVGIFDPYGIVDNSGNVGEILVGHGIWNTNQLEIVTIGGLNLTSFGGGYLPGYSQNNPITVKIWKSSENMLYTVSNYTMNAGGGLFDGLFSNIVAIDY